MTQFQINMLGELEINGDDILYQAPISNFKNTNVNADNLKAEYKTFLDTVNYHSSFAHINNIREDGKYILFNFTEHNSTGYKSIRNLEFETQLKYFKTLIEIARVQEKNNVQILWEIDNFILNHDENDERVKALLYEFGDMKIYDNTGALQGLKQVIICGLTHLNHFLGKPNKSDFIDKSHEVIKFAEDILFADNIDNIVAIVDSNIERIYNLKEAKRLEEEEKSKNSKRKLFKKRSKNNKIESNKMSSKDKIKRELKSKKEPEKEKKKFSSKNLTNWLFESPIRLLFSLLGLFLVVLLVFGLSNVLANSKSSKSDQEQELKQSKKLNEIYRDSINGDNDKAKEKMFALKYNKLGNKKDKDLYLKWLIDDKKYSKALSYDKDSAYSIGYKINDDNIDDIKNVSNSDKSGVLDFFIASYDKDFQTVIELANKVDKNKLSVSNEIVKAYLLTNQEEELKKYMDKIKEDKGSDSKVYKNLNDSKQYYDQQIEPYNQAVKDRNDKKDEVKQKEKEYEKAKKSDKKDKKKDKKKSLDRARESLESAEEDYREKYNDILNVKEKDIKEHQGGV
ncbi:hypothetical protein QI045_12620 [Staphylococcus saprophyticus]|nr:hypothetical protein [Staphylococcus saprophyticus]